MSTLTVNDYPQMVASLAKPGEAILASLNPFKCDLYHMSDALTIEAAELADAVKRFVIYEKDLLEPQKDGQSLQQNMIEELGDMEFYMEHLRQLIGVTRDETIQQNINKLGHRYKGGSYSNDAANNREDKVALAEGVDVYAAHKEATKSGRSFMGGPAVTLLGERYLLSVSSNLEEEAIKAQAQLNYIFDVQQGELTHDVQFANFLVNNGIINLKSKKSDNGSESLTLTYKNKSTFSYERESFSNDWSLAEAGV